jgi:hypothetical protein
MLFNANNILAAVNNKADVLNRSDLECISVKACGSKGDSKIYMVRYAYAAVAGVPTRVQFQASINKDLGQSVTIDPCHILVGQYAIVSKVYSKYPLTEQTMPKQYIGGMKAILEENPTDKLIEMGDEVRGFDGMSTFLGQVVGYDDNEVSLRTGAVIKSVGFDQIIEVKAAPRFAPIDQACYDYYIQIYPKEFVEKLTAKEDYLKSLQKRSAEK